MSNIIINKVKVIKDFPGYEEGDVLVLNMSNGLFESRDSGDLLDMVTNELEDIKLPIKREEVLGYLGLYFENISDYRVRNPREMETRMRELSKYLETLDNNPELLDPNINIDEARTVWQNMLWEYEWILGMKEIYGIAPESSTIGEPTLDPKDFLPMADYGENSDDMADVVDGNKLEEQNNEGTVA